MGDVLKPDVVMEGSGLAPWKTTAGLLLRQQPGMRERGVMKHQDRSFRLNKRGNELAEQLADAKLESVTYLADRGVTGAMLVGDRTMQATKRLVERSTNFCEQSPSAIPQIVRSMEVAIDQVTALQEFYGDSVQQLLADFVRRQRR